MRREEQITDLVDALTDPPSGGKEQMWVYGVIFAAIPFLYGIVCCVTLHAKALNGFGVKGLVRGQPMFLDVHGGAAVAVGGFCIFVASYMHFRWFWGNHPRLGNYYELGVLLSIIGIIGSIAAYVYFMVF